MKASLRAIRVNCGLSIEEAAKRIGISTSTLRKYENYEEFPYPDEALKIMEVYELDSIEQILFYNKKILIEKKGNV